MFQTLTQLFFWTNTLPHILYGGVHEPAMNVRCLRLASPDDLGCLGIKELSERLGDEADLCIVHRVHSSIGCVHVVDQIDVCKGVRQDPNGSVLLEDKFSHQGPVLVKQRHVGGGLRHPVVLLLCLVRRLTDFNARS